MPAATAEPGPSSLPRLTNIVDAVVALSHTSERVTVDAVIKEVGGAGFAPILLLPALAVATPLSGIPLFSSLMGLVICLVAIQMVAQRRHLWLPGWILRQELKGRIVASAFGYLRPVATWLDQRTNRRLRLIVRPPLIAVPQILCVLSGAMMPLLEFVPFSSSVMGIGVAILALGMLSRDGLVVLLGLVPYGIVGWLITLAAT
ncbi:MAG: exopolysaccharide biosynthesis protein [Pseudomonadota bacterium]